MKLPPSVLPVSFAVIFGIGGYLVGRQTSQAPDNSAAVPPLKVDRGGPSGNRGARGGSDDTSPAGSPSHNGRQSLAKLSPEELKGRMSQVITAGDAQDRARAWLDFVDSLEPGQFAQVVADFRAMGMSGSNMTEYAMLLSGWAKHDPLSALDFAEKNTGNAFARQTILSSWANTDLDGAMSWAKSHFQGSADQGNPWMVGVIRGIAASDPARASQLMQEMPLSRERGDALVSLVPTMMAQGANGAMAWADSLQDPSLHDRALREIAPRLAERDPQMAAAWLASTNTPEAAKTIDGVMNTWMKSNPAEAMTYFDTLPAGDVRSGAMGGVLGSMATADPAKAAAFLNTHRGDANDDVYQQFIWNSARSEPVMAANEIVNIQNPQDRDKTYLRMIGKWMKKDPAAAQQYLASGNVPANVARQFQPNKGG